MSNKTEMRTSTMTAALVGAYVATHPPIGALDLGVGVGFLAIAAISIWRAINE